MFRVGKRLPVTVVAPMPWFPLQGLIRLFKPHFRPPAPAFEQQEGVEVFRPRYLSVPGVMKCLDGVFMALGTWTTVRRLSGEGRVDVIDAHFGYPDGYAATVIGRLLGKPVTVTLRGTEVPHAKTRLRRRLLIKTLKRADRIFAVSESLKKHAEQLGAAPEKIEVVGNGVDVEEFYPEAKQRVRGELGIPVDARVLITVGGLVERKGFHRVMALLPQLGSEFADLHYLIVGGASQEGNWEGRLRSQAAELGLDKQVHFLGPLGRADVRRALCAADVFVLATRNEGWANVLLEAMACGLPVVATDVGGNAEVVAEEWLGRIVPFDDPEALEAAIRDALLREWDRDKIVDYARCNSWDERVARLTQRFGELTGGAVEQKAPTKSVAHR